MRCGCADRAAGKSDAWTGGLPAGRRREDDAVLHRARHGCAAACQPAAAAAVARASEHAASICGMCAELCQACGDECGKHPMDHCRKGTEACRRCEQACRPCQRRFDREKSSPRLPNRAIDLAPGARSRIHIPHLNSSSRPAVAEAFSMTAWRLLLSRLVLLALLVSGAGAAWSADGPPLRWMRHAGSTTERQAPCHSTDSSPDAAAVAASDAAGHQNTGADSQPAPRSPDCCRLNCAVSCAAGAAAATAIGDPPAAGADAAPPPGAPMPAYRSPALPRLIRPPIV